MQDQLGQRVEAGELYAQAERRQQLQGKRVSLLNVYVGYCYCTWLLAPAERAAWRALAGSPVNPAELVDYNATADAVARRAETTLSWVDAMRWPLFIALDNLSLARVGLVRALLSGPVPQPTLDLPRVASAVRGLRNSGTMHHLPRGLLSAALYHFVRGEYDLARTDLAECQQIAERGPMPLVLADVHLHRARMFRDQDELAKAAELIHKHGYGRRYEELADAEDALGVPRSKPVTPPR